MLDRFGDFLTNKREERLNARILFSPEAAALKALGRVIKNADIERASYEASRIEHEQVANEQEALVQGVLDGEVIMVDFRNKFRIPISEMVEVDEIYDCDQEPVLYDQDALGWD